uniref:Flabarin n=1 Tax=Paratrypanosoma confusum TaxID=1470209 RepID=A0A1B1FGW9_9TRYP|nr:flabarin [Paratrypanosoma confusum]
MGLCDSPPQTVDHTVAEQRQYIDDVKAAFKGFDMAMTNTMNAYRDLLSALEKVGTVFASMAENVKSVEVRHPVQEFAEGMRKLKESTAFLNFNEDMHNGVSNTLIPLREEIKTLDKQCKDVEKTKEAYDQHRYNVEKKEKKYTKSNRPLSESKGHAKEIEKRDARRAAFESKSEGLTTAVRHMHEQHEGVLVGMINEFCRSVSNFSEFLSVEMKRFRSSGRGTNPLLETRSSMMPASGGKRLPSESPGSRANSYAASERRQSTGEKPSDGANHLTLEEQYYNVTKSGSPKQNPSVS